MLWPDSLDRGDSIGLLGFSSTGGGIVVFRLSVSALRGQFAIVSEEMDVMYLSEMIEKRGS